MKKRWQKPQAEEHRRIKKADMILISVFLFIGLAGYLLFFFGKESGSMVRVTVDGKVAGECALNRDKVITVEGVGGSNTLSIRDGKADMTDADCPDGICVRHAPISRAGESIVCLPHRVVAEVVSEGGDMVQEDEIVFDGITR